MVQILTLQTFTTCFELWGTKVWGHTRPSTDCLVCLQLGQFWANRNMHFFLLGGSPVYRNVLKWPSVSCRFSLWRTQNIRSCMWFSGPDRAGISDTLCCPMFGHDRILKKGISRILSYQTTQHINKKKVFISQFLSVGNKYMSTCPTSKRSAWSTHTEHLNQLRLG